MADRVIEELDEAESLRLIAPGGIGRIAYASRFGPAVLPVNYKWYDGAIVFRTARHSALDEDLQTGIAGGEYMVAFEIDQLDFAARQGWSVLIQGPAHHVEAESERRAAAAAGVEPWAAGEVELVDLERHHVFSARDPGLQVLVQGAVPGGAEHDRPIVPFVVHRQHGRAEPAGVGDAADSARRYQPQALGLVQLLDDAVSHA